MQAEPKQIVRVDNSTRFCLTAIVVLLSILIVGLWADMGEGYSQAQAKQPRYKDAKAEEAVLQGRWGTSSASGKLAATQEQTNKKLDELIALFRTGQAKVQTVEGPVGVKSSVKIKNTTSK